MQTTFQEGLDRLGERVAVLQLSIDIENLEMMGGGSVEILRLDHSKLMEIRKSKLRGFEIRHEVLTLSLFRWVRNAAGSLQAFIENNAIISQLNRQLITISNRIDNFALSDIKRNPPSSCHLYHGADEHCQAPKSATLGLFRLLFTSTKPEKSYLSRIDNFGRFSTSRKEHSSWSPVDLWSRLL